MSPSKRVLFGLTGSISCYKACHVVSRLTQAGVSVQTVATPAALRFVGTATLEGLSGNPVFHDMWEAGHALDHISCAREADLAIVCPVTANTINRMAAGLADDLIGALFLAWERQSKPWYLAPAMNTLMWQHPATQASLARLKEWGCQVIEPAEGMLACGDTGAGRLADPDLITRELLKALGLAKA
jgi:phosphopantothenoylcysteine decarboxylase/phosphopantothenate--cysteine ligase